MVSAPELGAREGRAASLGLGSRRAAGGIGAGGLRLLERLELSGASAEGSNWLREENKVDTAPAFLPRITAGSPSLRAYGVEPG